MRSYLLLALLVFPTQAMAQSGGNAYQLWSNCLNMHLMSKMTDCTQQRVYAIDEDDFAACEAEEANLAASLSEEERAATMAAYHEELKMRVASSDCAGTPQAPALPTAQTETPAETENAPPQTTIIPVQSSTGAIDSAVTAPAPAPIPENIAPAAK